jgi:hypothetical protein
LTEITGNNGIQTLVIDGRFYYLSPFTQGEAVAVVWRVTDGGSLEFRHVVPDGQGGFSLGGSAVREFPRGMVIAGAVRAQRRMEGNWLSSWIDFYDQDGNLVGSFEDSDFLRKPDPIIIEPLREIEASTLLALGRMLKVNTNSTILLNESFGGSIQSFLSNQTGRKWKRE